LHRLEIPDELGHDRGLADPRFAGDEDDAAGASFCRVPRLRKCCKCPVALEQLHRSKIDPTIERCIKQLPVRLAR
jgi:hypothetical protein